MITLHFLVWFLLIVALIVSAATNIQLTRKIKRLEKEIAYKDWSHCHGHGM